MKLYIIIALCFVYVVTQKVHYCPEGCPEDKCCVGDENRNYECAPLRQEGERCIMNETDLSPKAEPFFPFWCYCAEGLSCLAVFEDDGYAQRCLKADG